MPLTSKKFNTEGVPRRQNGYLSGTYVVATVVSETVPSPTANSDAVKQVVITAGGNVTITPGWVPKKVEVLDATSRVRYEYREGMAAGNYIKTLATGVATLATDAALAVSATGIITMNLVTLGVADNDTVCYSIEG
jgi:hypothetical protein